MASIQGDFVVSEAILARLLAEPETLAVHFQPIIGFDSKRIVAAEALLRVEIDGVAVPPTEIIGVAVACGRIREVTRIVLESACREVRRWRSSGAGRVEVMVNLDASELTDPQFSLEIAELLDRHELPPDLLSLELTETALINASSAVEANLLALRALEVDIALDDFGTGYASLSHLRSVPLSLVKLDRQFIASVHVPGAEHEIVRSVIHLSHALGLRTIAEGVETDEQRRTLEALGCDAWQGFLESPALDPDAFLERLLGQTEEAVEDAQPGVDESADIAPDSFVLRRIAATRWAHLGGAGRGTGWAGIVDVDERTTPLLADALTLGVTRRRNERQEWLFGAYHATSAVAARVDADTVVIFGSPTTTAMPELTDHQWSCAAEDLAERVTSVSPAKRLADELELSEALQALVSNAPANLDEAMRHVVECIARSLSCEFGVIYLGASGHMAFTNDTVHDVDAAELTRALEVLCETTTQQRCAQNANAEPFPLPLPTDFGVRSWLAIPTAPQLQGIIVCAHTDRGPRGFTSLCQRLGGRLADTSELILHAAIEREQLHSEARNAATMASRDALTGVLNRRGWNQAAAAIEQDQDVSVLIVDVNDLKLVNDLKGHSAGDQLLITTANCLSAIVRSTDSVARLGGDEFGVLLPSADSQVMARIEAQLAEILRIEQIEHPDLGLAVGSASRTDGESIRTLIDEADQRMYCAKRSMKAEAEERSNTTGDLIG